MSVSREPAEKTASSEAPEKTVTYEQLHGMMVKLAHESSGGAATASAMDMGAVSTLASNP
jgi:hypothetical protein